MTWQTFEMISFPKYFFDLIADPQSNAAPSASAGFLKFRLPNSFAASSTTATISSNNRYRILTSHSPTPFWFKPNYVNRILYGHRNYQLGANSIKNFARNRRFSTEDKSVPIDMSSEYLNIIPESMLVMAWFEDLLLVSPSISSKDFYICNPLTRQWHLLPLAPRIEKQIGNGVRYILRDFPGSDWCASPTATTSDS